MMVLEGITVKGSNPKSSSASNEATGNLKKSYEDVCDTHTMEKVWSCTSKAEVTRTKLPTRV